MSDMTAARTRLEAVLDRLPRVAVAVSGGVDSMTLAWHAHVRLGPRSTMVHAVSPAVPAEATSRVRAHAEQHGWTLRLIDAGELADERYLANPYNRCFFCKTDLYAGIRALTDGPIVSGTNLDDLGDYRPGLQAAAAADVRHPFVEAGIDKPMVRALAAAAGLADLAPLPAAPCLSSRVETGLRITPAILTLVERAEAQLRASFPHGQSLRVRVRPDRLELQLDPEIHAALSPDAARTLTDRIGRLAVDAGRPMAVTLAPYSRGSAFVRPRIRAV